jgi:hypothetical protein
MSPVVGPALSSVLPPLGPSLAPALQQQQQQHHQQQQQAPQMFGYPYGYQMPYAPYPGVFPWQPLQPVRAPSNRAEPSPAAAALRGEDHGGDEDGDDDEEVAEHHGPSLRDHIGERIDKLRGESPTEDDGKTQKTTGSAVKPVTRTRSSELVVDLLLAILVVVCVILVTFDGRFAFGFSPFLWLALRTSPSVTSALPSRPPRPQRQPSARAARAATPAIGGTYAQRLQANAAGEQLITGPELPGFPAGPPMYPPWMMQGWPPQYGAPGVPMGWQHMQAHQGPPPAWPGSEEGFRGPPPIDVEGRSHMTEPASVPEPAPLVPVVMASVQLEPAPAAAEPVSVVEHPQPGEPSDRPVPAPVPSPPPPGTRLPTAAR